jgi:hypothetical protein
MLLAAPSVPVTCCLPPHQLLAPPQSHLGEVVGLALDLVVWPNGEPVHSLQVHRAHGLTSTHLTSRSSSGSSRRQGC